MKKKELENRIKELELELSNQNASKYDVQKSLENEQRFHNLIEQSIYPILIFKGEDMILEIANAPMLKVFNVGKEAFGKPFLDILPEMKDQPFMGLLLDVFHNHKTHYGKEQPAYFVRENGERETIYFNFVYHPYKENDGTVSGVIVNATDVTELVLARKKAEESEARFRSLIMQAPVAIGIYKGKEYIAEVVNELSLQMLSKEVDFVGKPLFDVLPELETQGFKALMDTVMQSGTTYYGNELAFNIHKNNISTQGFYNFIIQQLKTDDQSVAETIVVATDVTEQVLARKKVEESEHRYHNLVYTSPYMIAIFKGKDTIIEIANDAIIETWGKGKDIFGKSLFEVLPEATEQGFDKLIQNVYETGEPYHAYETPVTLIRNGKQELMHYNFIYQAQRNVDGEIVGVAILANEVTPQALVKKALAEQREIEQKALKSIEESNTRYHTMLMDSPFAFCVMKGKDMTVTLANDLIKDFWGKETSVEGKTILQVLPEIEAQPFPAMLDKVYTTGISIYANEMLAKLNHNGKIEDRYFNIVYQPYYEADNSISGVITIAYDVTEMVLSRKKIEESDKRYNMMLMHSPFTFAVLKGKDLVITLANDRVKGVWGKGNDVEGKSLLNLMPELNNTPFPALMDEVIATGIPYHGREVQSPHNVYGHAREEYFNFVFQPYLEADETVSGITIIGYDVTEQVIAKRKIEESELRFSNLIYTSPSAIGILLGEDLVITTANEPIIEIWGKGKEIMGKKYFEALPELAEQGYKEVFNQVYKTGIPFNAIETPVNILQNGVTTLKYYNFILYPQKNINGEITGIGIIASEVTSQAKYNLQIKESEERFRSLADNVPMHIFIAEPNTEASISYFNKYWLHYTGQTIEEALGRTWDGIIHPDDVQIIMDVYVPAFEKRQPYMLPAIRVRRYDGAYRWFQVHGNPRYLPNGEFMGFIGAGFDIHESKLAVNALKESEEHFRLMADLMPSKISNASADGSVTYFSKQWLDYSGYTFEELRDFGYHQIMHPDEIAEFQTRFQNAASTLTDLAMEMQFKNTEGDYIWHLHIASPIKDEKGNLKMWISVTTDISEQIKIRDTNLSIYEKHANELKHAKELAELARLKAEEAVKFKQQFLSNMSHEIRTPLNSILGFTNVLLKTELGEKQKDFVQAIKTSSHSLTSLINDILDLAKVDAGKMTFVKQPFDMQKSIKSILHSFDLKLKEKNLEFRIKYDSEIPSIVVGDSVRLNQIILNLMSNAIKFTHKGKIALNIKQLSEDEENVSIQFTVSDTGIGIADNKIDLIFNLFEQADISTSSSYGGTGLGLAIVKQLIEFQGGSISVSSKIGEGSTFSFMLPFGKTNMKTEEETETLKLDSKIKNLRVLVAEDVALNQLLIKIILSDFGFEHDVVSNGKMAIEKLQTNTYDIILMDLQMPEMSGFEATEYIRKTMKSNIPIIALTADVTTVDIDKCKEFGMDDYLSKPIIENQLYSKIVELVKKATIIID